MSLEGAGLSSEVRVPPCVGGTVTTDENTERVGDYIVVVSCALCIMLCRLVGVLNCVCCQTTDCFALTKE